MKRLTGTLIKNTVLGAVFAAVFAILMGSVKWMSERERARLAPRQEMKPTVEVTIAWDGLQFADLLLAAAKAKGYYDREFVRVTYIDKPDSTEVVEEVLGGRAEFGVVDIDVAVEADTRQPGQLAGIAPVANLFYAGVTQSVGVPERLGLADLSRLQVAVGSRKGFYHRWARELLGGSAVPYEIPRDLSVATVKLPADRPFILFTDEPELSRFEKYDGRVCVTVAELLGVEPTGNVPVRLLVTRRALLNTPAGQEMTRRLISVLRRTMALIRRNPSQLFEVAFFTFGQAAAEGLGYDAEVLSAAVTRLLKEGAVPEGFQWDRGTTAKVLQRLRVGGSGDIRTVLDRLLLDESQVGTRGTPGPAAENEKGDEISIP